ncbi:hypothetical protein [Streptomyces sp. NPDC056399]|uniref:hypothetical protein n=1 Tax=Streptomyces sp. NPDC056399 TaxID=3345807 RepID=UPI0035D9DB36
MHEQAERDQVADADQGDQGQRHDPGEAVLPGHAARVDRDQRDEQQHLQRRQDEAGYEQEPFWQREVEQDRGQRGEDRGQPGLAAAFVARETFVCLHPVVGCLPA